MTIFQYLHKKLREKSDAGISDAELAKQAGVSQQLINKMLNEPIEQRFAKVGFKTIVNLFPDFFDNLLKEQQYHANANGIGAAAAINGNAIAGSSLAKSTLLQEITRSIIQTDGMCDRCKIKALAIITKEQ